MPAPDFIKMSSIPRYSRECWITEKLDGTNATVYVSDDGDVRAGKRTSWITPENDNFGFAKWVEEHRAELARFLPPGIHRGEWWGSGINRAYGLKNGEKRLSLFNQALRVRMKYELAISDHAVPFDFVPVIAVGPFHQNLISYAMATLWSAGSYASPDYMNPEGVVVWHKAGNYLFKKTFEDDCGGKKKHKG